MIQPATNQREINERQRAALKRVGRLETEIRALRKRLEISKQNNKRICGENLALLARARRDEETIQGLRDQVARMGSAIRALSKDS